MPLSPHRLVLAVLTFSAAALTLQAASAQWIAAGRWGTEARWRYVVPGTWLVLRPEAGVRDTVSIHAEAENHDGRLALWCRRDVPGGGLVFERYFGDLLQRPDGAAQDVTSQSAALVVDDRAFDIALEYHPVERQWTALNVLEGGFLDAFGWGSRMDLVNASGETVAQFRLNGSGGARSALRQGCGL